MALTAGTFAEAALMGLLAGIVAATVTWAVERFGGTVGGILATTPTTIVPACIGFATQLERDDLMTVMAVFPIGIFINDIILLAWKYVPAHFPQQTRGGRGLLLLVGLSLAIWAGLGALLYAFQLAVALSPWHMWLLGALFASLSFGAGAYMTLYKPSQSVKGTNKVTRADVAARTIMAGMAIFSAVLFSSLNDVAAGLLASFPAIFLTSIVSLYIAQNSEVYVGAIGPMVLGSLSVSSFALLFPILEPPLADSIGTGGGITVSVLVCYLFCVACVSYPLYLVSQRQQHRVSPADSFKYADLIDDGADGGDGVLMTMSGSDNALL